MPILFYQLFGEKEVRIKSLRLSVLNIDNPTLIKELKLLFVERNETLLGVIDDENTSILAPKNDMLINNGYRLIYIS